jgi:hypothetical protein
MRSLGSDGRHLGGVVLDEDGAVAVEVGLAVRAAAEDFAGLAGLAGLERRLEIREGLHDRLLGLPRRFAVVRLLSHRLGHAPPLKFT